MIKVIELVKVIEFVKEYFRHYNPTCVLPALDYYTPYASVPVLDLVSNHESNSNTVIRNRTDHISMTGCSWMNHFFFERLRGRIQRSIQRPPYQRSSVTCLLILGSTSLLYILHVLGKITDWNYNDVYISFQTSYNNDNPIIIFAKKFVIAVQPPFLTLFDIKTV